MPGLVEKVGEIIFTKVKQRQVNKFNNLLKKEGIITGVSTQCSSSQTGRQAGYHPPGDSTTSQAVSTASQEGSMASQAGSQAVSLPGDSASSQASSEIPWEGSSLAASQAVSLPGDSTSSQASSTVSPSSIPLNSSRQASSNPGR